MNIVSVYQKFPTHHDCLLFLEDVRWGDTPQCPYCKSEKVSPRCGKENNRQRRWWCKSCRRSFSVMINTIFHGSRLPLQKWFVAIAILLNAKKGAVVFSNLVGNLLEEQERPHA